MLELLHDCQGMITRLEIFNLQDYSAGKTDNIPEISQVFIEGILGSNFPRPLSFYLSRNAEYLEAIKGLVFGDHSADPPAEPAASEPLPSAAGRTLECIRPSEPGPPN